MIIVYDIKELSLQKNQYWRTTGKLLIEIDHGLYVFEVCSGGFKRGSIPIGRYIVGFPKILDDTKDNAGYRGDEFPWVAKLDPIGRCEDSKGKRTGLYIHGKGKVKGTLGCVELLASDVLCYNILKRAFEKEDIVILEVH